MDLNQYDSLRRVLYTCADGDAERIISITQLTNSVYDLVAAGQQVQLEIGLSEDDRRHSVYLIVE